VIASPPPPLPSVAPAAVQEPPRVPRGSRPVRAARVASRSLNTPTLTFLLAAGAFLYALLFVPPFVPVGFVADVDGLIYALDGKRMCAGEVLYRDFFQFSTPGTSALYAVLIRTFGPRLWLPNLMLLAAGLGLAWVGIAISKKVLRPGLALLPSALFLVAIYQNELDPTHHWLSLPACAGSLAVLMERRTRPRILAAGALAGLAACFTQSRGLCACVGMGVFLCWESRHGRTRWRELLRNQVLLATGFVTTLIVANAYFAWKAGLARFLWCTAVFGARYYPKDAAHNSLRVVTDAIPLIPSMLSSAPGTLLYWFFIYACVPLVNILFFVRYWKSPRSHPEGQWARLMLLAFVGFFLLLGVAPAPMATRVAAGSLPGTVLLVWFADSLPKVGRKLCAALAGAMLLIAPVAVFVSQLKPWVDLPTAHGVLAIADSSIEEEYRWIRDHTRPGDYFLSSATMVYFNLDLRNPSPVTFLSDSGYNTPQQVSEVIRGLEQHQVRYILWLTQVLGPDPVRPTPQHHPSALRDYVRTHYQWVRTFANADEIWERDARTEQ
jgi:hypothetical protein